MNKNLKKNIVIAAVLLTAIGAGTISWLNSSVTTKEITIEIRPGMGISSVGRMLKTRGIVRSSFWFSIISRMPGSHPIKSGTFLIYSNMTTLEIFHRLAPGSGSAVEVTIPEGYNIYTIGETLEAAGITKKKDFLLYCTSKEFIEAREVPSLSMEGFLFPDTYTFRKKSDARDIIVTMRRRMKRVLAALGITLSGNELNSLVTMASMVEAEAKIKGEQPVIASVFHNRLAKKMRMDCDPTVRYGIQKFTGSLTTKDLRKKNRYNTYTFRGLPPGAICSPGRSAIMAAFDPLETGFFFFVARTDGSHYFSKSYTEHKKAVNFFIKRKENNFQDRQERY